MQSQWISWSPTLDNLVTASGSPGFTLWNLLLQGRHRWGIAFDNIDLFGKTDVLETLTYKVEQCWTIFREHDEVFRLKLCQIGHDVSGNIQVAMLCTEHMAFQKTFMSAV